MNPRTCPGCQQERRFRKADGICGTCKSLLADAWKLRETETPEMKHYQVWGWYYLPSRTNSEVGTALMAVCRAAGNRVPEAHYYDSKKREGIVGKDPEAAGTAEYILSTAFVEAVRKLHDAADEALVAEYQRGFSEGSNLLQQLAKGEVSVKDFEERLERPFKKRKKE